ncbi:MAG: SurA N-terminal domain-containing protein [Acidobacteriia bacterium]|nr:SurA N-terminal domain-containing protein [Terriglobia bacterium]
MNNQLSTLAWTAVLLVTSALPAPAGEVIDRIVATVNGHIILQSDWEDAVCYEAFTTGRALDQVTAEDRKAALDRLIDQELLREQMRASDFPHATDQEVDKRVQEIRQQYPGPEASTGWQSALARYGLNEGELKNRVALQLDLMRLVDARLRPTVQIDSKSIESYYNQELLPQIRQSGAKDVPLAEVTPKIKELLTQKRMNQLLTAWLQSLRAGSEIHSDAGRSSTGGRAQ